jgi:hypothetical protein
MLTNPPSNPHPKHNKEIMSRWWRNNEEPNIKTTTVSTKDVMTISRLVIVWSFSVRLVIKTHIVIA